MQGGKLGDVATRKFLYMYDGMTGEFGPVGTSGRQSVIVVVGRGLYARSGLRRLNSLGGERSCGGTKRVLTVNQPTKWMSIYNSTMRRVNPILEAE